MDSERLTKLTKYLTATQRDGKVSRKVSLFARANVYNSRNQFPLCTCNTFVACLVSRARSSGGMKFANYLDSGFQGTVIEQPEQSN